MYYYSKNYFWITLNVDYKEFNYDKLERARYGCKKK